MSEVLIVSRTIMDSSHHCIGGLELSTCTAVRLREPQDRKLPISAPYQIGQIWDIDYIRPQSTIPPHVENVIVQNAQQVNSIPNLSTFLPQHVTVWRGDTSNLFEGLLSTTMNGSGYISARTGIPSMSVGFWICNTDLVRINGSNKYRVQNSNYPLVSQVPYKGLPSSLAVIPAGTLLRASLATWWAKEGTSMEERCYLQLSGWYL